MWRFVLITMCRDKKIEAGTCPLWGSFPRASIGFEWKKVGYIARELLY